jgi:hypothetical protein
MARPRIAFHSPALRVGVVDLDEAIGLGERQRFQHQPVDRREDRRVGADAEREREERD